MRQSLFATSLFTICLAMPTIVPAQDWTPPENPDPTTILQEANADKNDGDYKNALAKHLWYHENALAIDPAQTGVRLSFAMGYWLELGEVYPPALEKLREIRLETEKRIRDEDRVRVRFGDFQEFVAINRTLRQEARTAELFQWLDEDDEEDAQHVFAIAKPALIKQKHFQLCGKYIDANRDIAQMCESYRTGLKLADERLGKEHREFTEMKFLNDVTTLIAILAKNDRMEAAKAAVEHALSFVKDDPLPKDLDKQLESALKGIVPKPWP